MLTENTVNLILHYMSTQPYKDVAQLINIIQNEAKETIDKRSDSKKNGSDIKSNAKSS